MCLWISLNSQGGYTVNILSVPLPSPGTCIQLREQLDNAVDSVTCKRRNGDEQPQNKAFTDGVDERVQNRQHE